MGGKSGSQPPQFTGIGVQTSTSTVPVTLGWGQFRDAPNVIWQGDFQAHQHSSGGKGGGKGGVYYTYSASFILAHGWGPYGGVLGIWKDGAKINSSATPNPWAALKGSGFSFFSGTSPQAPWSYMTTAHPDQALGYAGLAYSAAANFDMGQSNMLPQLAFELKALRWNSASWTGGGDADIALIYSDFLSDPVYGVGFDTGFLDSTTLLSGANATTTGDNAFQTYCRAMGWGFSPKLNTQNAANDTLKRWCDLTNTAPVWTGYALKFLPYSAETITANGVTYLPSFPVRYVLTDSDFMADNSSDPVTFERADPAVVKNQLTITITNRANDYNPVPCRWQDLALIDEYGAKPDDSVQAPEVCSQAIGKQMVDLLGARNAYTRNKGRAKLPHNFFLLEAGDVVQVEDSVMGTFSLMLEEVTENDDDSFDIIAFEWNESIGLRSSVASQAVAGNNVNTETPANAVNPPIIFEPPVALAGDAEVWIVLSGGPGGVYDPNWGGADIYLSTDNTTFQKIGTQNQPGAMGSLSASLATYASANPDTTHTLGVNLAESHGALASAASVADAAAGVTVSYVDGELIGYQTATLTGSYAYNLTQLYRGLYGSTIGAHASGTQFARLEDGTVFKYALPATFIGRTLYFKFVSFNIYGGGYEDISTLSSYSYTTTGAGYGTGSWGVPATPTGLTATAGNAQVALAWNANPTNDNVQSYEVWRASGTGALFASASKIATVAGLAYSDTSLPASTGYTYFLKAVNKVGPSSATAGVSATTSAVGFGGASAAATASEALTAGNVCNLYSSSGAKVQKANATDLSKPANCFVLASVANGGSATVYFTGQVITGLSSLTPGATYWLDTTAGGITTTPPSGAGNGVQQVGVALSATSLMFAPLLMVGV